MQKKEHYSFLHFIVFLSQNKITIQEHGMEYDFTSRVYVSQNTLYYMLLNKRFDIGIVICPGQSYWPEAEG